MSYEEYYNSDEEYITEDSWSDYNQQLIDDILERIEAIQKNKDENLFNEVKEKYPYFFNNVENLENIKIRADYDKKKHIMIPGSIEYKLMEYLEMPKEPYHNNLLSLHDFLDSQEMLNGGKKSRKSKKSRKTTKKSRKTTKKSKKSRKRKTLKKRKKSRK